MNGSVIQLKHCDHADFIKFVRKMNSWAKNITWRRMWIRKKDIFSFELVDGQTI
jgi:hypothetical protein